MKKRLFGILLLGVLIAPGAMAKQNTQKVEVIQRSSFVKWHRVEVSAAASFGLNEVLTRHYGLSATAKYHITPHWAVRLGYMKYFGKTSSTYAKIGDDYRVYAPKRILDFYAGAGAEYTLFMGKFIAFNRAPFNWDLHLFVNLGVTRNTHGNLHFTPGFGMGWRFAFFHFLSFNVEVGDYIYREDYAGDHKFVNNVQLMLGFSLFIPFNYKYRYQR